MPTSHGRPTRARVGLVVAFASLGQQDERAVRAAWSAAARVATAWKPTFAAFGLEPVPAEAHGADLIVYLGESSRFQGVAGEATRNTPVVLVKSTVEELLERPAGSAMRYRMCTGVDGIATALATIAPPAPTVDWRTLPWPADLASLKQLEPAEETYVAKSLAAFKRAANTYGFHWHSGLPANDQPFSVFLTMHDPAAALLADAALSLWPQCTVLAGDGMSANCAADGTPWSARLCRVRHWSRLARSLSTRVFQDTLGKPLPDLDSAGMVFGTLFFIDRALAAGAAPERLHEAGRHPGPLGVMRLTASGHPEPERIVVLRGTKMNIVKIETHDSARKD